MSYRHRRRGDVTASDRTEFVARRRDNGVKFGCVDLDRFGDGGSVGSSEDRELRVLCEAGKSGGRGRGRDLATRLKGSQKFEGKKLVRD